MFCDRKIGGHCGEWWCRQKFHDSTVLQRYLHKRLQKDHRRGFFRETNRVSKKDIFFCVFFQSNSSVSNMLLIHFIWFRIDGEDIRVMLWDTAGMCCSHFTEMLFCSYSQPHLVLYWVIHIHILCVNLVRSRRIWCDYQSLLPWCTGMCFGVQHNRSNVIWSSQRMEDEGNTNDNLKTKKKLRIWINKRWISGECNFKRMRALCTWLDNFAY